ncbi:LysR family transcriptional regulator [Rhodoferax sp.]|uniref:LysR family transcriptional regulator n=1 Tax=Rhodoferax sp. TaxID=50421 RepID=UPI001EB5C21C|nr:LysR family transcriptional regulator [Rhodoferax sp.]MBT9507022.1 LysR family transcriptional regulator [Rhodoferax sp.]
MNLKQLQQFVALAETGNFHKAAERMHMAQPPLSVSMRKLEDELGGPLFLRHPTGARLTAAGQAMLADARRTIFHAQQCQQAVAAALHGEGGVLRVGFIGSATYSLLPRLIPSFRRRFPKIELELAESTTAMILTRLAAHSLDLGLVRFPVLHPGSFSFTPLEQDEFVLAVPADSAWGRLSTVALSEAAGEPFIMYAESTVPNLFAVAMLRCQQSGFSPRVTQEAVQVQTIVSLVESGLGLALVPGVARRYVNRGVKFLRLSDNPIQSHISIALAALNDNLNPLVNSFTAHAQNY